MYIKFKIFIIKADYLYIYIHISSLAMNYCVILVLRALISLIYNNRFYDLKK